MPTDPNLLDISQTVPLDVNGVLTLLPAGREETAQLLNAQGFVDLIIPRGSQSLINYVRENATIPVIDTKADRRLRWRKRAGLTGLVMASAIAVALVI